MFPVGDGAWGVHRYSNAVEPTWGGSSTKLNRHLEFDTSTWNDWQPSGDFAPVSIKLLTERNPKKSPPLVDGLIRLGETGNIIAPPKIGKSWLVYSLALSVVTGQPWFGFATRKGRVLLLDNELPAAIITDRIPTVARAMEIDNYDGLDVIPLRGRLLDLEGVGRQIVNKLEHGQYSLVICDAWYRFSPGGRDGENSNSAITSAFNLIDQFASQTGAAWTQIHHSSKGNQSQKSVTDVGAGAGAQSRATDGHIVLRDHEDDSTVVMEAEVRSFIRPEPRVLKWEYPLWRVIDADPTALRDPKQHTKSQKDQQARLLILETLKDQPDSCNGIALKLTGKASKGVIARLLAQMTHEGLLTSTVGTKGRQQCTIYAKGNE